jgi:hypothetical protein
MPCPMFKDYVRECYKKIGYMPQDSYDYCTNESYTKCPFYRKVNNIGVACPNIDKCPIFKMFSMGNFAKFVEITEKYCLSEHSKECARYKIKATGQTPPPTLLPDGASLSENK